MASLPDIDATQIPHAASLAADRAPPGPTQAEQLRARARVIVQRFKAWIETGDGFNFRNHCPVALQTLFADCYEAKLNSRGYTLAYEGENIVISKNV